MRKLRWIATVGASAAVAGVTSTTAHAAERTILSAGGPDAIPNGYIVKDFSTASANSVAARFGGRVDRIFSTALNGFSAALPEPAGRRPVPARAERDRVDRPSVTESDRPARDPHRVATTTPA